MEQKEYHEVGNHFLAASAVTIGNFDGVHLGHRAIIGRLLFHAQKLSVPSVVITFDPHPRQVIFRGQPVPAIFPFSERARLIASLGVDYLLKVNFTLDFARKTASEFLTELIQKLSPRAIVIGHDFRFGRDREGDYQFLVEKGESGGFLVEAVPAVEVNGKPVSSSRVRALLQAGEIKRANRLLASAFAVEGEVVAGHHRGKDLGFATANLRWNAELIPPDGVYAGFAEWESQRWPAVINIGSNPTFNDQELSIEAHLLDFSGDLYQKRLRLVFYHRLRGEIKFQNPEDLAARIREDVKKARAVLAEESTLIAKAETGALAPPGEGGL